MKTLSTVLVGFVLSGLTELRAATSDLPFYQGKTLTIVEGRSPGGTGSLRVQAVVKYLQNYLPGNPAVAYQHIAGGGGTAAANHLANVAKRDGLTIGNIGTSVFANAVLSVQGVRYKAGDFVYFGSPVVGGGGPFTIIIRPELRLDTIEKLRAHKGLRFAQRSVGHFLYILDRIFSYALDLREPKWVLGYDSQEVSLALERGEADARTNNIHTLFRDTPQWLERGFSMPVVMRNPKGRGAEATPRFPQGRPTLDQFADTELKRAVLRFHDATLAGTSAFIASKGIPEPALKALSEAFDKVWTDPQFAREYEKLTNEPVDPIAGEEIERAHHEMPREIRVMEAYKQLIGAGPLPAAR
jgi:tripartite-type tricarboxylate transporter receptor subunit TctC